MREQLIEPVSLAGIGPFSIYRVYKVDHFKSVGTYSQNLQKEGSCVETNNYDNGGV